jgi:hypothetical protein
MGVFVATWPILPIVADNLCYFLVETVPMWGFLSPPHEQIEKKIPSPMLWRRSISFTAWAMSYKY